jgi:hypothetical protein
MIFFNQGYFKRIFPLSLILIFLLVQFQNCSRAQFLTDDNFNNDMKSAPEGSAAPLEKKCMEIPISLVALSNANINILSSIQIDGAVIMFENSHLQTGSGSRITGIVYKEDSAVIDVGLALFPILSRFLPATEQEFLDLIKKYAELPPTSGEILDGTSISSKIFNGNGGLTVINIDGDVKLTAGNFIQMNGGPDDFVILNINGNLQVYSDAKIISNGIPASHIIINMVKVDSGVDVSSSGQIFGTLLAPKSSVSFTSGSSLTGSMVVGKNFEFNSTGSLKPSKICL